MEIEIRYFFSLDTEEKIINYLKRFAEFKFMGTFYEKTDQYNHPMKEYDFYNLEIDGRFRVRKSINETTSKCMISWKKRSKEGKESLIHSEEEIEVSINPEEYDNLAFLLKNVLHLELVESYERYRSIFANDEIEIAVDRFPFGIALEIECKAHDEDGVVLINKWLDILKLNIADAYKLSWDDKYSELCKKQNKEIMKYVTFDSDMPKDDTEFIIN